MYQNIIFISVVMMWTVDGQIRYKADLNSYPCSPPGPTPSLGIVSERCYDTPGCTVPECCGIITGEPATVSFTYRAIKNVTGGTVVVPTKVALSTPDPLSSFLVLPVQLTVPPTIFYQIFELNPDMCYDEPNKPSNPYFCPQTEGNIYTYNAHGVVPKVIDTATVVLNMEVRLISEEQTIFCAAVRVRGISPNLVKLLGF